MRKIFLLAGFFALGILSNAQTNTSNLTATKPTVENRVSPLDSVSQNVGDVVVKVKYSRPYLKGRDIGTEKFVPFGQVWRTGANEATVFTVDKDVSINGKLLPAGKYSLYSIPDKDETVIIFNKTWDQWGTKYNQESDALRVVVPTVKTNDSTEQFTIAITTEGLVRLNWSTYEFDFKIGHAKDVAKVAEEVKTATPVKAEATDLKTTKKFKKKKKSK